MGPQSPAPSPRAPALHAVRRAHALGLRTGRFGPDHVAGLGVLRRTWGFLGGQVFEEGRPGRRNSRPCPQRQVSTWQHTALTTPPSEPPFPLNMGDGDNDGSTASSAHSLEERVYHTSQGRRCSEQRCFLLIPTNSHEDQRPGGPTHRRGREELKAGEVSVHPGAALCVRGCRGRDPRGWFREAWPRVAAPSSWLRRPFIPHQVTVMPVWESARRALSDGHILTGLCRQ